MPFEKFDFENLDNERRKAIAKSIRTISVEELKKLGEEIFRYADDPWRETFFRFIAENPGATFHHAITSDGVNIVYCSFVKNAARPPDNEVQIFVELDVCSSQDKM